MTLERMQTFSKSQQLLFLGSELERARVWQYQDQEKFQMALDRALDIIALILQDQKWQEQLPMIEFLKKEITEFRNHKRQESIAVLYRAL